ncbi:MAG: hypothetical protein QOH93_2611 [Chloroflexia bacterium]|nr:hypothetical protein [Chloroflexia bacterium]
MGMQAKKKQNVTIGYILLMERETRLERATFCLEGRLSTD